MLKSKASPEPTPPWRKMHPAGPPEGPARGSMDPPPPRRERLFPTESRPPRRTVTQEVDDADEAERGRQAHVEAERDRRANIPGRTTRTSGNASTRSATAKTSKEEVQRRRHQREAATAAQTPGAATAQGDHRTRKPAPHRPPAGGGSRPSDAVGTDAAARPDFAEPARSGALIPRRLGARGGQ